MYKLYAPRSMNFNPIIVLFLTFKAHKISYEVEGFQSYYSLISNKFNIDSPDRSPYISILL